MAGFETTLVTLAVIAITLFVAWYFELFRTKDTDDEDMDEDCSLEALQEKMRALTPEEANGYGRHNETYRWEQNDTEVILFVPIDEDVNKKTIQWELETKKISLKIKGQPILEGVTWRKINTEDSLWSFDNDEKTGERLFIWTLVKLKPTSGRQHWKCVVMGEPELDTTRFGSGLQTMNANDPAGMAAMVNSLKDTSDENS